MNNDNAKQCGSCKRWHNDARNTCDRCISKNLEWRANNVERIKAQRKEYYRANKERIRAGYRQRYAENPEKFKQAQYKWRTDNPEKVLEHLRKTHLKRYNLSVEEHDKMIEEQNGVCKILSCSSPPGKKSLFVDHDHETGKVRALLCQGCNSALGHAKESAKILRELADYIEKHK